MNTLTRRQKEITQATMALISRGGIQGLTTKALAAELSVSEPAIYRHFKNKKDILLTILAMVKEDTRQLERTIAKTEDPFKQLEILFAHQAKKFIANPSLTAIIFSEEIFQNDKKMSEMVLSIMNERQRLIRSIVEKEQKKGGIRQDLPAHQITLIIMGTLRLIVSRWKLTGFGFDLAKETAESWHSLESMIRA